MATETKVTLKLLVDRNTNKVLFAEAKKDFVDFLFGLLQIPIGSIISLLNQNNISASGSFGRVLNSVQNLESVHFHSDSHKQNILSPKLAASYGNDQTPLLLKNFAAFEDKISSHHYSSHSSAFGFSSPYGSSTPSFGSSSPCPSSTPSFGSSSPCPSSTPSFGSSSPCPSSTASFFSSSSPCPSSTASFLSYSFPCPSSTVSFFSSSSPCPSSTASFFSSSSPCGSSSSSQQVGYVKDLLLPYMVTDDLVVKSMSTISTFTLLQTFGVKDIGSLQENNVKIDFKKGLELVKAALVSDTELTDVFISREGNRSRSLHATLEEDSMFNPM